MIDFEIEPQVVTRLKMFHTVAEQVMRPISREYDESEHAEPEQFFQTMWAANAMADVTAGNSKPKRGRRGETGAGKIARAISTPSSALRNYAGATRVYSSRSRIPASAAQR